MIGSSSLKARAMGPNAHPPKRTRCRRKRYGTTVAAVAVPLRFRVCRSNAAYRPTLKHRRQLGKCERVAAQIGPNITTRTGLRSARMQFAVPSSNATRRQHVVPNRLGPANHGACTDLMAAEHVEPRERPMDDTFNGFWFSSGIWATSRCSGV